MPSRPISGSMMLLLALPAPLPVAAQTGAAVPTIAPEEYAARRDSVAASLGDGVTGIEWLSRAPREPAEIESAMARRGH